MTTATAGSTQPDATPAAVALSRWRVAAGALLSVVALAAVALMVGVRFDEVRGSLAYAGLPALAALTVMQTAVFAARAQAWHVCLRLLGGNIRRHEAHTASAATFLAGLLVRYISGLARIAVLRRITRERAPSVGALMVADAPLLVLEGAVAGSIVLTLGAMAGIQMGPLPLLLVASGVAAIVAAAVARRRTPRWLRPVTVLLSKRAAIPVCGWLTVALACQIGRVWLALATLQLDASLRDALTGYVAVGVASALPTGVGSAPLGTVAAFSADGVSRAAAVGLLLVATTLVGAAIYTVAVAATVAVARRRNREPRQRDKQPYH